MELSRISALLAPFLDSGVPHVSGFSRHGNALSPAQLDQISTYIDLLLRWNARLNLTAVRDPESIVTRHFGESLFLARHAFSATAAPLNRSASHREPNGVAAPADGHDAPAAERRKSTAQGESPGLGGQKEKPAPLGAKEDIPVSVIDVGSGAGFPGLPLKIWAPHISLTMIESNHKKAAFLREVSRALTLTDINVTADRAEILVDRLPPADLVTLRAVERFESIVPVAARFLAPAGRLALLIGAAQFPALVRLTPQLSWPPSIPIPSSESRVAAISNPVSSSS